MKKSERIETKIFRHPYAYAPTRFEYIAIAALQGLVAGRSIKDAPKAIQQAVEIAGQMEKALDSTEED